MTRSRGWLSRTHVSTASASASTTTHAWVERTRGSSTRAEHRPELVGERLPVLLEVGRVQRQLAPAIRDGITVQGHPGAVGTAVGELDEHRRHIATETLLDASGLANNPTIPHMGWRLSP